MRIECISEVPLENKQTETEQWWNAMNLRHTHTQRNIQIYCKLYEIIYLNRHDNF